MGSGLVRSTLSPRSKDAWWLAGALCDIVKAVYSLGGCGGTPPVIWWVVKVVGASDFDTHVCSKIGVGEFDVKGLQIRTPCYQNIFFTKFHCWSTYHCSKMSASSSAAVTSLGGVR